MKIETLFTNKDLHNYDISNKVVVVIDVLRATTTLITALNNDALSIISVSEIEKVVALKKDDQQAFLCGERDGVKIEGFDKGNSPFEYDDVSGRNLIFSSTNGSKTIEMAKDSKKLYIGALINAKKLAKTLFDDHNEDSILIACSGNKNKACVEDTLCAGYLINLLTEKQADMFIDDSSRIALSFYNENQDNLYTMIKESFHGKHLLSLNPKFDKDIFYCSQKDTIMKVPYFNKVRSKILFMGK